MTKEQPKPAILQASRISKRFGAQLANDEVNLTIRSGTIHALLGENGAGKSTLVKILYGAHQPDSGQLFWQGRPVSIASPAAARDLGIGMVFQHCALFESFNVLENIELGLDADFVTDRHELKEKIREVLGEYGLDLNLRAKVADLSAGERQRLEIVRCLLQNPKVLIMDEPTSVLTVQEARRLFVILRRMAKRGCAIVYISHRLEEVRELCDCATIMRKSRVVDELMPRTATAAQLAELMLGAEVGGVARNGAQRTTKQKVRLQVNGLNMAAASKFGVALGNIDFEVAGGQILAIAGIAGNGQGELFDALSGERRATRPECVKLYGRPVGTASITQRRKLDAAFIPEQRLGHGAVPQFRLSDNILLSRHATEHRLQKTGMLIRAAARAIAAKVRAAYSVWVQGADPAAGSLSGGNLQKFIVGRELDREPGVLVVNQPTWGVDAGSAVSIRAALLRLADAGTAIVVISQDLDELLQIADKISVITRGRLSKPIAVDQATPELIGTLMGANA